MVLASELLGWVEGIPRFRTNHTTIVDQTEEKISVMNATAVSEGKDAVSDCLPGEETRETHVMSRDHAYEQLFTPLTLSRHIIFTVPRCGECLS